MTVTVGPAREHQETDWSSASPTFVKMKGGSPFVWGDGA